MTDKKEIIIDNINVSDCEFLWKEKLPKRICNNGNLNCDCNSNLSCYFKQLARAKDKINYMEEGIKTVENARNDLERELKRKEQKLQEAMDNYVKLDNQRVKEYNELVDKYNNKEQECEELKKEKAEIKKYLGISDKTIIQRLEELQEFKDRLKISEYNCKQTLDEIEEYFKSKDKRNTSLFNIFVIEQEILDIINKAKKGN